MQATVRHTVRQVRNDPRHFFITSTLRCTPNIRHMASSHGESSISIMPLGGSVTYGVGSSDGNGYRDKLRRLLLSDGCIARMVGSRKSGSMLNNENEGWRGFRIDQITEKARRAVACFQPDVFAVNAGSNDCLQDLHIDHAGERLRNLLALLWDVHPHSAIALSTLLPNRDADAELRVLRVNTQIRNLVEEMAPHRKIVLVDLHVPEGPQVADLVEDGTHPNDAGYHKMGFLWYKGIRGFARRQQPYTNGNDN